MKRQLLLLVTVVLICIDQPLSAGQTIPRFQLVKAKKIIRFPAETDSNSPAVWFEGMLYLFNSSGHPRRSIGYSLGTTGNPQAVTFNNELSGRRWLEAVIADDDGTFYGFYHYEPSVVCEGLDKTAPQIGAARSSDGGYSWIDLGIIIKNNDNRIRCDGANKYFVGGTGDFSVALDQDKFYLYLYFTSYDGDLPEQGVAAARMLWSDRDQPVGNVFRYHERLWIEPGINGRHTPIFPAAQSWFEENVDSFWGPSIHWNTELERYVMLLNRTNNKNFLSEGMYISFAGSPENADGWSGPQKILNTSSWYPQVMGLEQGEGTDKQAGKKARFFVHGTSEYEIYFYAEPVYPPERPGQWPRRPRPPRQR
ncbi:MAG: hypothetical protein HY401_01655 [Elusimicrobia bacterium]|nr:hypothetical protein [Elusimicrobiota bacterium]